MWLGRVLMSFNLQPCELPTKVRTGANPMNEPKSINFQLFTDLFEISMMQYAKEIGGNVWVRVSHGESPDQEHIRARRRNSSKQEGAD